MLESVASEMMEGLSATLRNSPWTEQSDAEPTPVAFMPAVVPGKLPIFGIIVSSS